jgi:hypothetical protein
MQAFIYRLVERLQEGERSLSRNRHFQVFVGAGRKALRIDRHLRDLEAQLALFRERGERPELLRLPDGGAQLTLRDPKRASVRTARLAAEEVELLARRPAGAWALADAPTPSLPPAPALQRTQPPAPPLPNPGDQRAG